MKPKSDGVREYTKAAVEIYFEKDHVCCQLCPLLQTYSRNQCMRTGELIEDTGGVGMWCPLKFVEETDCRGSVGASQ